MLHPTLMNELKHEDNNTFNHQANGIFRIVGWGRPGQPKFSPLQNVRSFLYVCSAFVVLSLYSSTYM